MFGPLEWIHFSRDVWDDDARFVGSLASCRLDQPADQVYCVGITVRTALKSSYLIIARLYYRTMGVHEENYGVSL